MHTKSSTIIRTIIIIISGIMLVWSLCNKITEGTFIGFFGFGAIIAVCVFIKPILRAIKFCWKKIPLRVVMLALSAVVTFFAGMCIWFSANMLIRAEVPVDEPKAVVVLGCLVKGETPSLMLNARLEAAVEVIEENPDALIVLCGGMGGSEKITEAEAMCRYLSEKGIPEERMILEDKSTSTEENIAFAAEILKEHGISDDIIIVTNEFHQYRAYNFAKRNELTTGAHSAHTFLPNLLNYWLREWAGLFVQFFDR